MRCLVVSLLISLEPALFALAKDPTPGQARLVVGPETRVGDDSKDLPHVEPVVAVNPRHRDNLVVASLVVQEPRSDAFSDSWTVQALVSDDGGATWTRHRLPGLDHRLAGDPWLSWSAQGTVYLSCLVQVKDEEHGKAMRVWLYESTDGGRQWSHPVELPFSLAGWLDHPVLDVADGDVVVFATGGLSSIAVSRAIGGAEAFDALPAFRPDASNNNLGSGIGMPNNRLVFSYFSMSMPQPSPLWAIRSVDGGPTYERALITSEHIPVGFPRMSVDRSRGPRRDRIYSVWVRSDVRPYVMLATSDDLGASWSEPVQVHSDSTSATRALPVVAVNGAGVVAVAWIDGRHHEGSCWDVYATASLDGGATFLREHRLTPETSCPNAPGNGAAGQRWRWGGDYIAVASDTTGAFYVAWSDSRTGVYQVWMTRIEVD